MLAGTAPRTAPPTLQSESSKAVKPGPKMERRVEIRVRHLDCENEVAAIARGLAGFSGISNLKVYAKAGKVSAEVDGHRPRAARGEARRARLPQGARGGGAARRLAEPEGPDLAGVRRAPRCRVDGVARRRARAGRRRDVCGVDAGGRLVLRARGARGPRRGAPRRDRAADEHRGHRRGADGRVRRGRDARLPLLDQRGGGGLHRGEDARRRPRAHEARAENRPAAAPMAARRRSPWRSSTSATSSS